MMDTRSSDIAALSCRRFLALTGRAPVLIAARALRPAAQAGATPAQLWQHDKETPGAQMPYDGPLAPLDVTFPPYSTTMLVLPPRRGLPTALLWAGAAGAALIGGILALRRRQTR